MRLIDTRNMEIVSAGLPWSHAISPCSKQAIHLLERNTKVVTWLMPRGGAAQEQIPCIQYKGKHFSLSLRMQKAIYRHVRLKKGFKNEETVNGTAKLRIPDLLLKEKIRTQSRFDVRGPPCRTMRAPRPRALIFVYPCFFLFSRRRCARRIIPAQSPSASAPRA